MEMNPLSVDSFAKIFSHSVGCLFVLFRAQEQLEQVEGERSILTTLVSNGLAQKWIFHLEGKKKKKKNREREEGMVLGVH